MELLAPVDGSPASLRAVKLAIELAAGRQRGSGRFTVRSRTARSPRASAKATSGTAVTHPRSTRAWKLPNGRLPNSSNKIASVGVINVAAS